MILIFLQSALNFETGDDIYLGDFKMESRHQINKLYTFSGRKFIFVTTISKKK